MGTHLCENHALEIVGASRLPSSIQLAVQLALVRGWEFDIRTLADAAEFLAVPERVYAEVTREEYQFLGDFRDLSDI